MEQLRLRIIFAYNTNKIMYQSQKIYFIFDTLFKQIHWIKRENLKKIP